MKKRTRLIICGSIVLFLGALQVSCEDPFAAKAHFQVENNSTGYNITEVYCAKTGLGSNRINDPIGPGESKTFELSAEGDYIYNLKVVVPGHPDSPWDHDSVHFYDGRRVTVMVYDGEIDDYFSY